MTIKVPVNPLNQQEESYLYLTPSQASLLQQWLLTWKPGTKPIKINAMSGDITISVEAEK